MSLLSYMMIVIVSQSFYVFVRNDMNSSNNSMFCLWLFLSFSNCELSQFMTLYAITRT